MKEHTAEVNRKDLLKHALRGIDAQITELANRSVEIQKELNSHNSPLVNMDWKSAPAAMIKAKSAMKAILDTADLRYDPTVHKPIKKRKISAEGRERISAAQKKRWAAKHKEAKNAGR